MADVINLANEELATFLGQTQGLFNPMRFVKELIIKVNGSLRDDTSGDIGVVVIWLFGVWPNKSWFIGDFDSHGGLLLRESAD
jgi:hypothetical protein